MKKFLLTVLSLAFLFTGNAWGAEDVYKTALFGSSYNSGGVSSYGASWTATNNGFTVNLANWNNNNNGWAYIKAGHKTTAYVGTITTDGAIDKKVTKVVVTIDAITANNVNSIKLYTGSSADACTTEAGSFDKSTGAKAVTLTSPTASLYYRISFDCKAASNGCVQVSKVEYYYNDAEDADVASFTVSPTSIDFGTKEQGATVEAQDVTVTLKNTDYAIATLSGTNADAFDIIAGEELTATGTVSVRPTADALAVVGTYTANLDVEADGVTDAKSVALSLTVTAPTEVTNLDGSITYNFSSFTQGNDVTFDGTNYTIELHKNNGSTAPQWNVGASEARVYAAGSVVVKAAEGYTITEVVYDYTVNANSKGSAPTVNGAAGSTNAGTWVDDAEHKTWTGSDAIVTLSTSGSAGNLGFKTITVTLAEGVKKNLTGISVTGTPAVFWKGDAFNHDGMTVTAHYSNADDEDVTENATFSTPNMALYNEAQTVTVTYKDQEALYNITVKTIANTQAEAYTVTKAKELIDDGKDLATEVYVKGTIDEIVTAWSDQYNNITYGISGFQLFRCATNGYGVGDDVVAYGKLTKYSSTYELAAGNTIVAATRMAKYTIADITVASGENISPVITTGVVGYSVVYESDNVDVVSVEDGVLVNKGIGEANIKATISADGYKTVVKTFKVTVTTNATLESVTISGELENAIFTYGDAFDKAGLTAKAHYSDGSDVDVTSTATWTFNGESALTLTASGDVNVVATFDGTASAAKVCAVTVNKKASSIAIENIELEATRTATIKATTTPADAELTYTIEEGDAYISIEDGVITGVAEGTATVRADYAGTAEYEAASKTFTVNVVAFVPTFTWSDAGSTNQQVFTTVTADADPVSIEFAQGESSSKPTYYTSGTATRFYQNNTLTISGKNGKLINKIVVNYVSGNVKVLTPNVGTYNVDGVVGTWSGLAGSVTLTNKETACRFNSIVVSYVDGTVTTLTIANMSLKPTDGATTIAFESNKVNPAIVYSNYNEAVITIAEGKVTPVTEGSTTVTATIAQEGTYTAATTTFTVTVANKTVTTLSFPEAAYSVKANETFVAPTLTTTPANLTGVKYTSSNTAVAEVDENTGAVTVKAVGTTTIKATFAETADYEASEASYELTVVSPYTDVITRANIGVDGTSYSSWSKTFVTETEYAGLSNAPTQTEAQKSAFTLRGTNSNTYSGIISTKTMGYAENVTIKWSSASTNGRTLKIYGTNSALTSVEELTKMTAIATATYNSENPTNVIDLSALADKYSYIGLYPATNNAMYFDEIDITWTPVTFLNVTVVEAAHGTVTVDKTSCLENAVVTITATPDEDYELASLKVYKTGDEATEVTITDDGKFTMPAYDVTVAAEFTLIPVVRPEGDEYAMVAQSGEKYYALTMTPSSNYMSAAEVTVWNGMVRVAAESEKENIAWIRNNTDASNYTFQTPTAKYLTATSGETYLKLGKSEQKWTQNTNGSYSAASRTIGLATTDFRNYASASNPAKAMQIVVIGADAVAVIGNTAYTTLADAVTAANTNDEIVLLTDVNENIVVPAGKNIVLDLNEHTLNGAQTASTATIKNLGTLTIENGTVKRAGAGSASYYIIENYGTMTLNCNVEGSASSSLIRNNAATAKMTFVGGEYTQTGAFIVVKNDLGEVIINDGTFSTSAAKNVLNNWDRMTINGGTFNGRILSGAYDIDNTNLTINGGTFNTEAIRSYIDNGQEHGLIEIKGGEFTNASMIYVGKNNTEADANIQVAVSGGKFANPVPVVYCTYGYVPAELEGGKYGVKDADGLQVAPASVQMYGGMWVSTYCAPFNFVVENGYVAIARMMSDTYVQVDGLSRDAVIPAGAGVIIVSDNASGATIKVAPATAPTADLTQNALRGTLEPKTLDELKAAHGCNMIMALSAADAKFYRCNFTGEFPANRAFLPYNGEISAIAVRLGNMNPLPTAVENLMNSEKATKMLLNGKVVILRAGRMYDLNGHLLR